MKVLGITTTQEVYIGSKEKNFRNNEFLVVQDPVQGSLIGEIVEAKTYNRFIPLDMGGDFVDAGVYLLLSQWVMTSTMKQFM